MAGRTSGGTTDTELKVRAQAFKRAMAVPGTTQGDALLAAGYAPTTIRKSAKQLASKLLATDPVKAQPTLSDILHAKGMTDEAIVDILIEGLKANKVISAMVVNRQGDGMSDANSMTKDFVEVPDHPTRGQYVDRVAKLRSYYPDPKLQIDHNINKVVRYELLLPQLLQARECGKITDDAMEVEYELVKSDGDAGKDE
jgi:hypothetical protein